jgi:hypothetical protein
MVAPRAILMLALLVNPLLLRAAPCAPTRIADQFTDQIPVCCEAACTCSESCGCSISEPDRPIPPPPSPAPTQRTADLLGLPLPSGGLIGILPSEPPRVTTRAAAGHRPHISCASVNALLCIWTT